MIARIRTTIVTAWLSVILPMTAQAADHGADIAPDIARIIARGTLVVAAYKTDMPPFFYMDDQGKPSGIDVELATDIAQRLGVRLSYARIADSFDQLPQLVAERRADVVISYLSRTLRRAALVRFTQPYVRLRQVLMASRTKTAPFFRGGEKIEALNSPQVQIGVEEGSSYADFATERFPQVQIRRFASNDDALVALMAGQLHAVMVDEGFATAVNYPIPGAPRYNVPEDWGLYVKTLPLPGASDPIAMATHRDDLSWLAWLDTYIADRKDDGTLDRILNRHLKGAQQ
ncbi:ABC transporter substrate-binding protein [Magnetospirillum sulfuroxidans]|uniref:Amino acid ABC transporter substrate-binding protein n=1 Tax=Magnetospirillum sulfuroxidans TaxID=611300 RepID=A0ABS5IG00_9PROT|nr:ABC transporter substrate-binding protein [Magnetospirillum sulfuroxidans]MBR9973314.1 amino acid ABC transporter substrate-binding protein [Magnetospirillum sulfuroxidans]